MDLFLTVTITFSTQLAGAVEYADCISAEGVRSLPNECPGYDTDGETSVLKLWWMWSTTLWPLFSGPLTLRLPSIG